MILSPKEFPLSAFSVLRRSGSLGDISLILYTFQPAAASNWMRRPSWGQGLGELHIVEGRTEFKTCALRSRQER